MIYNCKICKECIHLHDHDSPVVIVSHTLKHMWEKLNEFTELLDKEEKDKNETT